MKDKLQLLDEWPSAPEPLLPGLGESLETIVDYPEVVFKHAVRGEYGKWKIDDSTVGAVYRPPNRFQTCFAKIEQDASAVFPIRYFQFEYYQVPEFLHHIIQTLAGTDETWIVTEVNNAQICDWLMANGVIDHSEEIISNVVADRSITYRDMTTTFTADSETDSDSGVG